MRRNDENSTSIPVVFTRAASRGAPSGGKPPLAIVFRTGARQIRQRTKLIKDATCDVAILEWLGFQNPGCNWGLAIGRLER
jgi:hypothetical protein